jgi:hypothetical protein
MSRLKFSVHHEWRVDNLTPFDHANKVTYFKDFMVRTMYAAKLAKLPHSCLVTMFRSEYMYEPATYIVLNNYLQNEERNHYGRDLPLAIQPAPDYENYEQSTIVLCEYLLVLLYRYNKVESTEGIIAKMDRVALSSPNFYSLQTTHDQILTLYYRIPPLERNSVDLFKKLYNAIKHCPSSDHTDTTAEKSINLCRRFEEEVKHQRRTLPDLPITNQLMRAVIQLTAEYHAFYEDL